MDDDGVKAGRKESKEELHFKLGTCLGRQAEVPTQRLSHAQRPPVTTVTREASFAFRSMRPVNVSKSDPA